MKITVAGHVELTSQAKLAPSWTVQPDLQYYSPEQRCAQRPAECVGDRGCARW
jgi:hypothetical protein